jgi:hypothetical protein
VWPLCWASVCWRCLATFGAQHVADPLGASFNLVVSPISILTAAVFGLTPGLLIDRLKERSDDLKSNLRSTEPQMSRTKFS